MTEPGWYRQPGLACEYCGQPGHLVPLPPPPVSVVAEVDSLLAFTIKTAVSCPEHRFLVISRHARLDDEHRFAERDHGRPVLGDDPYPEQIKRSIRRLRGWDGADDGR